nr:helix-turn-helix domain containing protein [Vibrio cholerae]
MLEYVSVNQIDPGKELYNKVKAGFIIKGTTLGAWCRQSPGSEALVTLHKTLRVDLNWLLTGEENSWPTTEDRKEVCVNLMEYIEMEFEAESGT